MANATAEDIETAMRLLACHSEKRQELARAALAGRSRFDRNLWIDEQIEIYQKVLSPAAGSASFRNRRVVLGA
jgi:hypothetical protein